MLGHPGLEAIRPAGGRGPLECLVAEPVRGLLESEARNRSSLVPGRALARVVLLKTTENAMEEPTMHEPTDRRPIETTLWELINAIHEVGSSQDEAFAVLEMILAEGRISVFMPPGLCSVDDPGVCGPVDHGAMVVAVTPGSRLQHS